MNHDIAKLLLEASDALEGKATEPPLFTNEIMADKLRTISKQLGRMWFTADSYDFVSSKEELAEVFWAEWELENSPVEFNVLQELPSIYVTSDGEDSMVVHATKEDAEEFLKTIDI